MSEPPRPALDPAELARRLRTRSLGRALLALGRAGSTNDEAFAAAAAGSRPGLVVTAERQSRGRGRNGAEWVAPEGSALLLSLLLAPLPGERALLLTLAAAVAAAGTLRGAGAAAEIKWPNDVLGARGKLAGVLCESRSRGGGLGPIVLGLGVNVDQEEAELPPGASSLRVETGRRHRREELLADLLGRLEEELRRVARGEPQGLLRDWEALAPRHRGGRVRVELPQGSFTGTSLGLAPGGALAVLRDDGRRVELVSATVRLL